MNDLDLTGIDLEQIDLDLEFPTDQPIVSEFQVIVDTREQAPYGFTGINNDAGNTIVVPLVHRALESGDYAIDGHEHSVAVERKSLRDFYGSISSGRARFEREIERLNQMAVAHVVVEADWESILHPESFTQVPSKVATRTMQSWSTRYPRVHWWPMPSRRHAEVWTYRLFEMWWRQMKHQEKEGAVKS